MLTEEEIIEQDKEIFYIGCRARISYNKKDKDLEGKDCSHVMGQFGTIIDNNRVELTHFSNRVIYMRWFKVKFDNGEEFYFHKGWIDRRSFKKMTYINKGELIHE